jgi:hypothetical protein
MVKAKKVEPGSLPTRSELSLGNKSTKYGDLTWAAACKVHKDLETSGTSNKLIVAGEFRYYDVPAGHSGQGIYAQREAIINPCGPRAIAGFLATAKKMVETGAASSVDVVTTANYAVGHSQPGHHARWDHGGWERDDGLGRTRRTKRRTKRR